MQFMEHLAHKKNILVTQFMEHEGPNDCRMARAARKSAFAQQILDKIVEPRYTFRRLTNIFIFIANIHEKFK